MNCLEIFTKLFFDVFLVAETLKIQGFPPNFTTGYQ